jgi:hypothetical protein
MELHLQWLTKGTTCIVNGSWLFDSPLDMMAVSNLCLVVDFIYFTLGRGGIVLYLFQRGRWCFPSLYLISQMREYGIF